MKRTLWALVILGLSACGGTTIGAVCNTRSDCSPSLECVTAGPGGYCSRGCVAEGDNQDCPESTICTFFGGTNLVCSTTCNTDSDCRINYECVLARGTTKTSCRPVGAK